MGGRFRPESVAGMARNTQHVPGGQNITHVDLADLI
jgi:hypothetical protein